MSAFQISVTPNRLKNAKKKSEARQPTDVILAPFSERAVATFEDVPVTKTARRILNIINPSDEEIKVVVTKGFKPDLNLSLEWTSKILCPHSQTQMEIIWNPLKEMSCKETLQLTDSRNFRKDVAVVLKSSMKKTTKTVNRFPNISSGVTVAKTLKLKSPIGMKSTIQQNRMKRLSMQKTINTERKPEKKIENIPLLEKNEQQREDQSPGSNHFNVQMHGKENLSPTTPSNASNIFDKIQFTSALEITTKSPSDFDYLASLPTPVNRNTVEAKRSVHLSHIQPRRLPVTLSPDDSELAKHNQRPSVIQMNARQSPSRLDIPRRQFSPKVDVHQTLTNDNLRSTFEPKIYTRANISQLITENDNQQLNDAQINNKTFELNDKKVESVLETSLKIDIEGQSDIPTLNMTTTITTGPSRPLSIIEEEERSQILGDTFNNYVLQNTFNLTSTKCTENLKRDIQLVGTPLRKQSESMQNLSMNSPRRAQIAIKGSMPNLNEMGMINHIEQNRYYHQQHLDLDSSGLSNTSTISTASTIDIHFKEHEILAQSSRYNIHEIERKSVKKTVKVNERIIFKEEITPVSRKKSPSQVSVRTVVDRNTPTRNKSTSSPVKHSKRAREKSVDSPCFLQEPVARAIVMSVSPPKRTKYDPDDSNNYSCNVRTTKWSKTKPKTLKIQKTLTLLRKPVTPRRAKPEPRVMLYDSDIYLQTCINPDPFAATTTCDPFLAATMYLDERSVNKHETQFKKWLNALVTLPADLDADCNQNIDVGRLFNEVRNQDLALAPTKEEQCMNYLTKSRIDSLRKAAVQLFMSEDMRVPCSKVAVLVNKQALKIRSDRDLHRDVVMQRQILELLLSFNPLWLRIGLEVTFGEIIHLHSNSDVVGLSTFILNRLFRDKYLEQKYSRAYILSEEYSEQIKKFTLQKFLFLLFFLDKAKNKRIIKHNPCLFMKSSHHKETKQILLRFSSELLANIGDITRDLRRVGYVLTHKQNFLDEFNYAFKNLAVDLRDGIRLTRVMEIILLRDDLTKQLRVPAISRLQRIFNVNLALKALAEASFSLTGNITAADIVDGHREKTLSLLWQIIYKFRAPKFNTAATVIQTWWRRSWLKVVINRRIRYKIQMKRIRAAIVIQSAFRGYTARRYCQIYKQERTNATICIQKYVRRHLVKRKYNKTLESVIHIQRWYRSSKLTRIVRINYLYYKQSSIIIQSWYRRIVLARKLEAAAPIIREFQTNAKLQHEKAIIIQRVLRSYTIRKKFQSIVHGIVSYNQKKKLKNRSASRIQTFFHMIRLRKEFLAKRQGAINIQKHWRAYNLMKTTRYQYLAKKNAVVSIQQYYKSYLIMKQQRQEYLQIRQSVQVIQNRFRANKLAKQQRHSFLQIRECTIKIQQKYRATIQMRKTRTDYLRTINSLIQIQRRFRANKAMQKEKNKYQKIKEATTTIQQYYRAQILMKAKRKEYLTIRSSVIKIQQKFRATILARQHRLAFLSIQYHTILIQQQFRANRLTKIQRAEFIQLRQAVITIQQRHRANILMKQQRNVFIKLKNVAFVIQKRFRAYKQMKIQRAKYLGTREAVVYIQMRFREYLLTKSLRISYIRIRTASIIIQTKYRAYKSMQIASTEFRRMKKAAITIQSRFRAKKLMELKKREYEKLKKFTTVVQRRYRANIARKKAQENYLQLKTAAIILQRRFRAYKSMQIASTEYRKMKKAAITIQSRFRAKKLMDLKRREYETLKKFTTVVQRRYRANIARRKAQENYLQLKTASIILQRRFRAFKSMQIASTEYRKMKNAALTIQSRFRAKKLMELKRREYEKLKKITIILQNRYRANIGRKKAQENYLQLKTAAIILQRRFKALQLMKIERMKFSELRNSVIKVQQIYRAKTAMQTERTKYLLLRKFVIIIQQRFRAIQLRNVQRAEYINLKKAAILLQSRFRAQQYKNIQRTEYLKLRATAVIIQRRLRANKLMEIERAKYLQKKHAAVIIQKRFRATKLCHNHRAKYVMLRKATVLIQRKFKAQQIMKTMRCEYLLLRKSTIFIQMRFRANKCMQVHRAEYIQMKQSAIKIQQFFRALQLRNAQREEYLTLKRAALTIQARFRAQWEMCRTQNTYKTLKKSAIYIQRSYRAKTAMQKQRADYLKLKNVTLRIQELYRAKLVARKVRLEFVSKKSAAIIIQRRFIAQQLMKVQHAEYQHFRYKSIVIQQHMRSYLLGKKTRHEYLTKKTSTIKIQRWYRAIQLMCKERLVYQTIVKSTLTIQKYLRATIQMRRAHHQFLCMKHATIKIQHFFRSYQLMKTQRNEFQRLKKSVIVIQTRYRFWRQMIKVRNQFLLIKSLVICIQQKYRANRIMKIQRSEYLQLKSATIFIQQKYRGRFVTEICRQRFLEITSSVLGLQRCIRGYMARKRFNEMMTPEMREIIRRKRAAKIIQRFWRGYLVRKKLQSLKMRIIRQKIKDLKETAKPKNALKYKIPACVKFLKGRFNVQEAVSVLTRLENLSRTVPQTLMEHAEFIATFCYGIMAQAIRSEADKHIIELCSRIILNLARYDKSNADHTFQEHGLVTIAQMLLRWCDKDCGIFNTLCTLIWVFAHCPEKEKKIREFMTTHEAIFMVRETKKLVLRKENMRKNVRKPNVPKLQKSPSSIFRRLYPSLEPDFGVVKTKPYIFNCSVFAFDTVLSTLKIDLV